MLNLRGSIRMLAHKTPGPLRSLVKRVFAPPFLLRYVYPAVSATLSSRGASIALSSYPARAVRRPDGLKITFRSISSAEFSDSFTEWIVDRVGGAETKRVFAIETSHGAMPEEAPAGIIFHVGRCGATLVSQNACRAWWSIRSQRRSRMC